ncbi:transient receptor potential channel pyrexia-like [Anoplophora glabripennis]|uniref:transient receptor potential channel pyrexia-like n=1 Tax=Anoplophora glabripennis TaxID=217634 RepID=UPI0008736DB2|nr:transient receptor potential channel pyrexia-like [Anoplophora glabripennis]
MKLLINEMKEFETVPLYETQSSTNSSAWQSQNKISGETLERGFERYEFIDCGTPPEEEAPDVFRSLERTTSLNITEELCPSTIRTHLLEHMSVVSSRLNLLFDIENKKTVQEKLEVIFENSSKQEINIAFLWAAFVKRWDLLEGFLRLGADLNYHEPKDGLGALHLVAFSDCIPGTQFLISQGCDVNAIYKCYAPLHCAAFGDSCDTAMILLHNGASVQALTNTRFNSKESVLHCAVRANSVACIRLFSHEGGDVGQVEFSGMSPVHLAADLGRTQGLKILLEVKGVNVNAKTKDKEQTALHLAAENSHAECIEVLLEKGANADIKNHMSQTPLHLAARAKAHLCVELLLEKGRANPNIEDCDKRTALHTAIGRTSVSSDIIDILIKYGAHVNKRDQFGYTPLHVAALNGLSQCVEMLINHGADVTTKSKCGITPLGVMRRKIPASLVAIKNKLDSAITLYQNSNSSNNEVDLRLDFRCILQHSYPQEISFLNSFVDEGQKELLMHPLCSAFIYLKWRKIRKYYIARMFFCLIFVLSLSLYVLTALARNCSIHGRKEYITGEDDVMELCEDNSMLGKLLRANPFVIRMQWFVLVGITGVEILRKMYGLSGYKTVKQYFSYPENILEWLVILSVFITSFIYTGRTHMWQNHVGAFAVLFGWTNLMLMIGQLPVFGSYVAMYTKIQAEFAKLLLAYSCLLIGFAVSFCIMFPDSSTFANPFIALISAIVMMSGELNLDILVDGDPENPPLYLEVSAQITFTLFVLFVTIILMNLLVGIAVDDIQGLQKTAGLSKLVRQTKLISHIEQALFSGNLPQTLLKLLHWSALVSPRAYRVILNVKPLNHREKRLPRDILEAAHQIARNNLERMSNSVTEEKGSSECNMSLSLLQSDIEKRDRQFEQLSKEIKELKSNFNMYQKSVEQLINTIIQSRGNSTC